MILTFHGGSCVKLAQGDATFVWNPISRRASNKPARFGADVALVSLQHDLFAGIEEVTRGESKPFVIMGPGEYEVGGAVVRGYDAPSTFDGASRTTIYRLMLDGVVFVHLGALSSTDISADLREHLEGADILFVPIGGDGVLAPDAAHALAVALEPHVIVPVHYPTSVTESGKKGVLEAFLKEEGSSPASLEKFLFRNKKELESKESEVIVLAVG